MIRKIKVMIIIFMIFTLVIPSNNNHIVHSNNERYLVVISFDALNSIDFDKFMELPNFSSIIKKSTYCKNVISVYPSLTYPAHTSIITGMNPDKHGIVNNQMFSPLKEQRDWYFYSKDIKVDTLYSLARDKGMTTAELAWPVTAKSKIDYNIPEMWTNDKNEDFMNLLCENGTKDFVLDMKNRYGKEITSRKQPQFDDFITNSSSYIIENKAPQLLLIHLGELDSKRHGYGVTSKEANEVLKKHDIRLGKIINSVKKAGIYKNTTFVLLGDHGFLDTSFKVNVNVALRKAGLISLDEKDNIKDWKAFADSCDGSSQVYLKNPLDRDTREKVENILKELKEDSKNGIEEIFDKNSQIVKKTNSKADFILEAKKSYYFSNEVVGEEIVKNSKVAGTHGYLPTKENYRTVFIVSGPEIVEDKEIREINMVDEAPILGKIIGVKFNKIDGQLIDDYFK